MEDNEPEPIEMENGPMPPVTNPWLARVAPVLLSIVLSSVISVTTVAFGWKASMDTINAVSQVRLDQAQEHLKELDRETVKTQDLAYRDQLLDARLSTINIQILELKDQISNLHNAREGR